MTGEIIGQILDGKYCIDKQLGEGGMGAVYRATHLGTERPVAIKVIRPQFVANQEFIERFRREAKAAGLLRHPNVVDVTDFGFATVESGQIAYLVMEYLAGESLGDLLKKTGSLPLEFVVDIVEQICLAIGTAHQQGIIHRDLKPDNIWLEPNGRGGYNVKVLDFGLAKLRTSTTKNSNNTPNNNRDVASLTAKLPTGLSNKTLAQQTAITAKQTLAHETSPPTEIPVSVSQIETKIQTNTEPDSKEMAGITQAGAVLGTPLYMSPEQCLGEEIGPQSDIYTLAVIVYQLLSGELPFQGISQYLLVQHIGTTPPELKTKRPDLPESVSDLLMVALSKKPEERPASAAAFAGALRARTEGSGLLLRHAFTIYSQHFSTIIRISLLANTPLLCLGTLLLISAPLIKIKLLEFIIFFLLLTPALGFTFVVNRMGFALFLEQLEQAPLSRPSYESILTELFQRLGIESQSGFTRYLRFAFIIHKLTILFPVGPKGVLSPQALIVEKLTARDAIARSKVLVNRLRLIVTRIAQLAVFIYAIPASLFFLSAFGITQIFNMEVTSSVNLSFTIAIVIMGMNGVWLVAPLHMALAMAYFQARKAGGE